MRRWGTCPWSSRISSGRIFVLVRTVPAGTFTPCYEYKQATLGRTEYNKRILSPGIGEVESSTYSQKTGGGEYLSVFSQLRSYVLK